VPQIKGARQAAPVERSIKGVGTGIKGFGDRKNQSMYGA
jgi:hypothetical protein